MPLVGNLRGLVELEQAECSQGEYSQAERSQAGTMDVWSEQAWRLLVTQVTVHADGSAEFLFKGENRITVDAKKGPDSHRPEKRLYNKS